MDLRLLFFAKARQDAGTDSLSLSLDAGATLADLRELLVNRFGGAFSAYGFAVNEAWQRDDAPLHDGDEIAVLPPISGGAALITDEPLDPQTVTKAVSHAGAGAVVLFLGTVRDQFEGVLTEAVEYQGYRSMAERELRAILKDAEATGDGVRAAATHRLGRLAVGELSVVIAASAPHRDEAFHACRFVIEGIKARLPVWKKEFSPGGAERWHEGCDPSNGP